jgi:branched-chain amino acid transport system substrate-binding protein
MWKGLSKYAIPIIICLIVILTVIPGCKKEAAAPAPTPAPAPAPAPAPVKDKIVVGMSRSLSGPIAIIDDSAFRPVYETWVKEVNAAGGINVGGKKMLIELKIYDDKSDPATMAQLTEKLILEDKVDFVWGGGGTSFIYAQAPIANKYNKVLITMEGGASTLREMLPSMPYIFVTLSFSDWYEMPVLADMLASKGVKTAYITYISDLHGVEYNGQAGIEFGRVGIQILGSKALPPDIKDLSPVIKEAKASGADVFMCFAYPDQVMPAVGTSIELGYNPKAWLGGPGVNFGFFHTAFGPMVEGVMGWASWNRKSSPALNALADKLYTGKPEDAQDWWGQSFYWAGLDMWKAAIEKAGGLDNTKIRDILATEHFQTVLGETWFDKGLLNKETHPGEVGQWINGVYELVGGNHPTAQWVYPKPPWPAAPPK